MGKVQWSLAFSSWITDGLPTFPAPCFRTRVNAPHPTSTDAEIHSAPDRGDSRIVSGGWVNSLPCDGSGLYALPAACRWTRGHRTVTMTTSGSPKETGQSEQDPVSRSPDEQDPVRHDQLTAAHRRLLERTAHLPVDGPRWGSRQFFLTARLGLADEEDFKRRWVGHYADTIKAAAREAGIPESVLAGIAYREAGGKPEWMNTAVGWVRRRGLSSRHPDKTSYGPMEVQVRRAAEALGYDPADLTPAQRGRIISSLKNPHQGIIIAAYHLRDLKKETSFAHKEPHQMTLEEGRELAARYNGGPYWRGRQAQSYARQYERDLPKAIAAINHTSA